MRAALAIILCCCGSKSQAPSEAKPPEVTAPPSSTLAPDRFATLNLQFEVVTKDHPSGWHSAQADGEWGATTDQVHGGTHSLRIAPQATQFVAVSTNAGDKLAGKHVRVHGWIRTQDVTIGAALWLRADRDRGSVLDNMGSTAPHGTTPWSEAAVEIDVPSDAKAVVIGAFVSGKGVAWFDDLRAEVSEIEVPHPIALAGTVVTADGKPAAGAEVALVGPSAIDHHVTADAAGNWKLDAQSGKWGLSASTATASGFLDGVKYARDTQGVRLVVNGGVAVHGHTNAKPLDGAFVALSMPSEHDADVFAVPVAADGSFTTQLPRGTSYVAEVIDKGIGQITVPVTGDRVDIAVPYAPLAPPSQPVVDWIGAHAMPLATVEAGHGFDDLAPIGKAIGSAHVIALGEATHGTREFFQMKHRMLEYMVAKLGVTVFAIEANQPECRAIDDYVIAGKGDAKQALAGIYFWTWNTEEVLAMIEWMRVWNADPKHANKVHFTGFDMQTSSVAYSNVTEYLNQVGSAASTAVEPLGGNDSMQVIAKMSAEDRAKIVAGLAGIGKAFDANRTGWSAKHTTISFDDARHDLTVLEQALAMFSANERDQFGIRDRSMADNIEWLRQHSQQRTRMMVWAHNGHIANLLASFPNMGALLRKRYAHDYENIGFIFGDGGFQAIDGSKGNGTLTALEVGPAPDTDGSTAFMRTSKPLLALDLHAIPASGDVHEWFAHAHPYREIGAVYFSAKNMAQPMTLPDLYDAVIFVAHTTAARAITH